MKFTSIFLSSLLSIALFVSCKNDPKPEVKSPETTKTTPSATYQELPSIEGADQYTFTSGKINWIGTHTVGSKHNGSIAINEGTFYVKDGRLIGANATIDMNAILVEDIKDAGEKADLESHLKDSDFFDVKKFPTGTIELKDNLPNNATPDYPLVLIADLTLKGVKKPVRIPAKVSVNGNTLQIITPGFAINRTDWGITYSSGIIGTVKDKAIDDFILLNLEVIATKK